MRPHYYAGAGLYMLRGNRVWKRDRLPTTRGRGWIQMVSARNGRAKLVRRYCKRISFADVVHRLYQQTLQRFNFVVEQTNPFVK